jgi:ribosomal protein S18 acetylase RimI-like enzyme
MREVSIESNAGRANIMSDNAETTVEIAPFTIDAYDQVLALWRQCEGVGLSRADSRENVAAYLDRNPAMSFLAHVEDALVGAVLCGHDGRRGFIWHLAVHPQFRRRGIGRRLVDQCVCALRHAGIEKCVVIALDSNRDGIAFWERIGWLLRKDVSTIAKDIGATAAAASTTASSSRSTAT